MIMQLYRKLIMVALVFGCLAAPVALTASASAVDIFPPCNGKAADTVVCKDVDAQSKSTQNPIVKIIKAGITVISYVVGVAAIIGILASAIRFITANGDSSSVASARSGLAYSLIGVAVVALAQTIVIFVLDRIK